MKTSWLYPLLGIAMLTLASCHKEGASDPWQSKLEKETLCEKWWDASQYMTPDSNWASMDFLNRSWSFRLYSDGSFASTGTHPTDGTARWTYSVKDYLFDIKKDGKKVYSLIIDTIQPMVDLKVVDQSQLPSTYRFKQRR